MTEVKRGVGNRFRKANTFYEHLKLALEFHGSPSILRSHSPLATPYFLRQSSADSPLKEQSAQQTDASIQAKEVDWGTVLSTTLDVAMQALWPDAAPANKDELLAGIEQSDSSAAASCYHYFVLELNYFKRLYTPAPNSQSEIYNNILHIGRTTHDRHLKEAVEHLGDILLKQLRPALRLEMPAHTGVFLGRKAILEESLSRLNKGQSISFIGPGGIGKTTLATMVAEEWQPHPVFWFTIRRNFNDQLSSLLFALGYFLHSHGGSGLWLQLVANGGKIDDLNLALSLALSDLKQLPNLPLLCFDEIDLLHATDIDSTPVHHMQMLTFIESLLANAPLLFVGQQAAIETDITVTIDQLSPSEIGDWMALIDIAYTPTDLEKLEAYTRGNPRLLTLCFAYHHSLSLDAESLDAESNLADTLARLPSSPGLLPIWSRVRRRLPTHEISILYAISVFRGATPLDAWLALDWEEEADDLPEQSPNGNPPPGLPLNGL